ncbi:MAG: SDR family NAD(P)-dependent oxidoreductase [Microbacteriaceae bacterium]|nr:SDR family NAD(P)-dependent oxidoreductase [Microbacteriaceae bacterium]
MTKRAVVTGASSGIGEAAVRRFRAAGWEVLAVARRTDRLEALAAETGAEVLTVDVTSEADVERLATRVRELGGAHVLVNNAGGAFGMASFEASSVDDWRRMYEVNVIGLKLVTSALLPILRASVAPSPEVEVVDAATIVNITSVAAYTPYENGSGYNAAKFAARAITGVLRLELSGEPIRVVEVAPGMVQTEFSLVRFEGDAARAAAVYEGVHELSADDVAREILHACELPPHIDLDLITVKPVAQSAQYKIHRGPLSARP